MELEKSLWTHEDFEKLGWHDCFIYSMGFERIEGAWTGDLLFDIDYIFKWVCEVKGGPCSFWVAPCTLIFEEVIDLKVDLNTANSVVKGLEISDLKLIKKEEAVNSFHWRIELQQGSIEFVSNGLLLIVRQKPIHIPGQRLTLEKRGGISFDKNKVLL